MIQKYPTIDFRYRCEISLLTKLRIRLLLVQRLENDLGMAENDLDIGLTIERLSHSPAESSFII